MTNIHKRIADMTDLAKTYAEDGAFYTAANRLRELADEIDAHAKATEYPLAKATMPIAEQRYGRAKRPGARMVNAAKEMRAGIVARNPEDFEPLPAPGKVMEAQGGFVPPLAHLTEEQQRAVRQADYERDHDTLRRSETRKP